MNHDVTDLWNFGDAAGSEMRFREALATADGDWHRELSAQLARSLGLQGRFDEGHRVLDALTDVLGSPKTRGDVCVLLERGRLYNSAGQSQGAIACFERAAETNTSDLRIDALHMIAIADPSRSQSANEQALAEAQQSPDPRANRWRASLLNNLGWSYHEQGDFTRALECFLEAVELREAAGAAEPLRIARWCVARCLRSLGEHEAAMVILAELSEGEADGFVAEEIAECLLALGKPDEARPWFRLAAGMLGETLVDDPARLQRLTDLGSEGREPTA